MKPLKYVIFRKNTTLLPVFIPKDTELSHADVSIIDGTPDSAGFAIIDTLRRTVGVYGESVSLNLKSKERDKQIIEKDIFHYL
jgi:hypothetical protein